MPDLTFRGRPVRGDRALIMGIVDPTSPSTRARDEDPRAQIRRAAGEGADVIDLGGIPVEDGTSEQQEIDRIVPAVEWARATFPDAVLSVDTHRHAVAEQACRAGADLLNDLGGNTGGVLDAAAAHGTGYVCRHTGGGPDAERPHYTNVVDDVIAETTALADEAAQRGVPIGGILIDPALDVHKETHHSLTLLRHLDALVETGWPVLVAVSDKDVIGETLDVDHDDRLTGTLAATALAAHSGAAMFRVHEVARTRQTVEMVASVDGYRAPARTVRWA